MNDLTFRTSTPRRSGITDLHSLSNSDGFHKQTILNPDSQLFYQQFSLKRSPAELDRALKDLTQLDTLTLATLHFASGVHPKFYRLIMNSMRTICAATDGKKKGLVFIHLVKSINRITDEIKEEIFDDSCEQDSKENLRIKLEDLFDELDSKNYFMCLDLSKQNLGGLDMTKLSPRLSFTNFREARMNQTKFGDAELRDAIFDRADLSTATGTHLEQFEDDRSSTSSGKLEIKSKNKLRRVIDWFKSF